MLIVCNNKGCMKNVEAKLDPKTNDVICPECGQVISNISESMKRTLKTFGQIIRDTPKQAFTMACMECNANRQVVLDNNDNPVCSVCHNPIRVHAAMKQALLEVGERVAIKKPEKEQISPPKPKRGRKPKTQKK